MDIRYIVKEILLVILFISFHKGLGFFEDDYEDGSSFGRCPWIRNKLKNGRVRYRYKGRVAKFLCDSGYDLAGKRSSTCVRGQWSNPVPVCVARGCLRVPTIANGHVTEMYRGALLVYDCNPGYTIDGVASIHCDGRRWSSSPPTCVVTYENPDASCDFESPDLCGWCHDPNHDFDWKRNQFTTPSGHAGTGPSFDHTFGEGKGGYYLYIEASSPRKTNDTARLFSPVYPPGMSGGCFTFWYHMYGATTGGLKVYLKPESHVFDELLPNWEKYGNQGNEWKRGSITIPQLSENFQIVIEGLRGVSYVGDSAIDDVSLTTQTCESMENETGIVENTIADSCRGRCRENKEADSESSCSCSDNCYDMHTCCNDYTTFCFDGNDTTVHVTDEALPSEFAFKTSLATSTTTDISTNESKEETKSSTEMVGTTTSKMVQTASSNDSSTSLTSVSTVQSITPDTSYTAAQVTNASLPYISTTPMQTTDITSSSPATTTSKSTPISTKLTTISTTKSSTTTVATTTSSTTPVPTTALQKTTSTTSSPPTTASPTTTSSATSPLAITIASTTSSETTTASTTSSETTTAASTTSSETTTTEISTPPPTPSSTTFTSLNPASTFTTPPSTIAVVNKGLPDTTFPSTSATTSSTVKVTSSTPESTTRKTYNLRPRKKPGSTGLTYRMVNITLSTGAMSTATAIPIENETRISATYRITSPTPFERDFSTSVKDLPTSSRTIWHSESVTASYVTASSRQTTISTTKETSIPTTTTRYIKQTTHKHTPHSFRFTSTNSPSVYPATSDSFGMDASKSETKASGSSAPIVISLIALAVCIAGGVAYYVRKQKSKRQSKLSDDSEMRFLQENDYMDYSDASALDRILVK